MKKITIEELNNLLDANEFEKIEGLKETDIEFDNKDKMARNKVKQIFNTVSNRKARAALMGTTNNTNKNSDKNNNEFSSDNSNNNVSENNNIDSSNNSNDDITNFDLKTFSNIANKKKKNTSSFHDEHVQVAFWAKKDLAQALDIISVKKGDKSMHINNAIRNYLIEYMKNNQ